MAGLCRRILSRPVARVLGQWQRSISQSPNLTTSNSPQSHSAQSLPEIKPDVSSPSTSLSASPSYETILTESLKHPDYFQVADLFTVEDLFNARVHLGHTEGCLDPHMNQFVFGSRLGQIIIDLDQTAEHLRKALNFAAHIAFRGGIILFVGRQPQHQYVIEKTASECGEYAHCRWWGAVLTDANRKFGSVTRLPDLIILLHTMYDSTIQHYAIRDAAKVLIPTIGIVDSNCNGNLITYPVPGNDDSAASIKLYCNLFKTAIMRGKDKRKELLAQQNTDQ